MEWFLSEALDEFKAKVMYIGAFVNGALPKTTRILSEELPDKNPIDENHVTLFFLGDFSDIGLDMFDDILRLPKAFTVRISGYGCDGKNQGVSVVSEEFDFGNPHMYGNTKATPHITYSWDENVGGLPVKTGKLAFSEIAELDGVEIELAVKAVFHTGEMVDIQYFKDRASGLIPPMNSVTYHQFANHDQNTPFHCYDLRNHTIKVVEYIQNHFDSGSINPELKMPLIIAAQWHDIGKLFTKSTDKNGYNIYPGHPKSSAELFEKKYNGKDKQKIAFFIANHDSFLYFSKMDLTDDLIRSKKESIQSNTAFRITSDDWLSLALLMEADESAKNPIVVINGNTIRTMEEDIEKVHFLASKLTQLE